ncbi:MAG: hypothetical protein V4610_17950 [Pseudomonadota bacterium]|jgi:hypothetical protein|uniref:Uncharacterized protein n=1 Tax=hydrothermal vent metagenome TaxID=652676 RepID=A0A170PPN9_9ZZZZ
MAEADSIACGLHPAVVRQAGFAAWTADPAIATLFAILRDLDKAGARLEALQHDRPDLGADAVRGDIGAVVSLYERCPAHFFGHGWRTRANGGACAGLWELLAARRDAWIHAQLEAEGFRPDAATAEKDERTMALCDEAVPVELAWARFQAG